MTRQRRWLTLLAIVATLSGLLPDQGWAQSAPPTPQRGGIYDRLAPANPISLDPARVHEIHSRLVLSPIFDGLTQFDKSLNIRPALAETWRASRDGVLWTFTLRKGVKFHHGRELTAEDVVYSLTRVLDPATQCTGAYYFATIKGADAFRAGRATHVAGLRVLDRSTVQIELAEPGTPLPLYLAVGYASIVPKGLVQRQGERFGKQPVGTGAFQFVEWVPNQSVTLAANPDYFEGRPYLDGIRYRILPGEDLETAFAAFRRGELHETPIPAAARDQMLTDPEYTVLRGPHLGLAFLGLRNTIKPLDDRRVRQALNSALDRPRLMREAYRDRYPPGIGILPPGIPGYDPHYVGYPYDPQQAARLLAEAGYPKGQGLPVLPLWSARKNAETEAELGAIAQMLGAVGIRVEIHYNTDWASYAANVYAGAYPLFRLSWLATAPSPDAFLAQLLESTSPDNMTQFKAPAVDALLRQARRERDWPKKLALNQAIERQVVGEAPLIPLYYPTVERLFQRTVHGMEISPMGDPYMPMKKIWLERDTPR